MRLVEVSFALPDVLASPSYAEVALTIALRKVSVVLMDCPGALCDSKATTATYCDAIQGITLCRRKSNNYERSRAHNLLNGATRSFGRSVAFVLTLILQKRS